MTASKSKPLKWLPQINLCGIIIIKNIMGEISNPKSAAKQALFGH